MKKYSSVITAYIGVAILLVVFAIMNPNFIKPRNLFPLVRSICPYLLVGIGQGIVCITGNIDLSIGSVLGMSAMISATLICNGTVLAILIDLVCCLAVGVVNGVLVGKFKLPPFIGTLGTMTICRGLAELVNGNYNTGDIGSDAAQTMFRDVFYYKRLFGPFYISVIIALVIWFCFNYLMNYTRTGRHIYAIGSGILHILVLACLHRIILKDIFCWSILVGYGHQRNHVLHLIIIARGRNGKAVPGIFATHGEIIARLRCQILIPQIEISTVHLADIAVMQFLWSRSLEALAPCCTQTDSLSQCQHSRDFWCQPETELLIMVESQTSGDIQWFE